MSEDTEPLKAGSSPVDPDLYDLADYRDDQIRGRSARAHGAHLQDNPYSFGTSPGTANWHAWREGWFMEHGKRAWEQKR